MTRWPAMLYRSLSSLEDDGLIRQVAPKVTAAPPDQEKVRLLDQLCRAKYSAHLETTLTDLRLAFRGLMRNPAFSGAAIVSVALAIGANSAIFSLVSVLLLRPLPVRDPGELVRVGATEHGQAFLPFSTSSVGTWGPFGVSGGGLRVQLGTDPYIGGFYTTGQGTNTMTAHIGVGQDVSITAERIGLIETCIGYSLDLSGSQDIDYAVYPYYEVTASPGAVSSGDTVTFTASSHWSPSSEQWRFKGGDTTSTPGASGGFALQVCTSASTCEYAPTGSGRMYRQGVFEDSNTHAMPGPIVWVGTPPPLDLELSASDSTVTRGDSVEFSVRNLGLGGELNAADIMWKFLPDSVPFYPSSDSLFAPDSVMWDPAGVDSVWAGPIVHPGRVIVTGVQGGTAYADTFVVNVTSRIRPSSSDS